MRKPSQPERVAWNHDFTIRRHKGRWILTRVFDSDVLDSDADLEALEQRALEQLRAEAAYELRVSSSLRRWRLADGAGEWKDLGRASAPSGTPAMGS